MRKGTVLIFILLLLSILAVGTILVEQGRASEEYRYQMEALHLKTASQMHTIKVAFWGGLVIVVLLSLVGIAVGLVRAAWRRPHLIHPHDNGIFPIIHDRAGRQTYYHDPNRQLAGAVAYKADENGVEARHLTPPGDQGEQLQVTSQAQAAQLLAAAGHGRGLTAQSRQLAERAVQAAQFAPACRLPEIVLPDQTIPEERYLLAALKRDWENE